MNPGRTVHMHLDVKGLLLHRDAALRPYRRAFTVDGRRTETVADVRRVLVDALSAGMLFLPVGPPCEGWSYHTGCPGHPQEAG
jgi:hypothetical protein